MTDRPYSSKALHFISLSLKVNLEQMEERLAILKAADEEAHEDEIADLLNDSQYLRCLIEETEEKMARFIESLG